MSKHPWRVTNPLMYIFQQEAITKQYNVVLMGQAHWYLQARITKHANFDIILDQSRCIVLICNRFLPSKGVENVTDSKRKRYAAPLPYDFVATKEDRSESYAEVLQLQEKFGFEYTSAIGMFIYLMNIAFILHFPITKLEKFNTLPGRTHFKALVHLLNHLRCNYTTFGITYYSELSRSPIAQLTKESCGEEMKAPQLSSLTLLGKTALTLVGAQAPTCCFRKTG